MNAKTRKLLKLKQLMLDTIDSIEELEDKLKNDNEFEGYGYGGYAISGEVTAYLKLIVKKIHNINRIDGYKK